MVDNTSDPELVRILTSTRSIALVGASPNPARASHGVGHYLARLGYRVIPVNPAATSEVLFGERVRTSLSEVGPADMVDVFRRSDAVPEIVEEAIAVGGIQTIWLQLGVRHSEAAARAEV